MSLNINRLFSQMYACRTIVSSSRLYARWMNRDPAKVLLPFDEKSQSSLKKEKVISLNPDDLSKKNNESAAVKNAAPSQFPPQKAKEIKTKREEKLKKRDFFLKQCKVFDENNDILYEKVSTNDGRIR